MAGEKMAEIASHHMDEREPVLPIRVLVADDQALIRRGLSLMLDVEPDIEVVGQAADGVEAVELALRLRPDVILMDLHMPHMGGVAATREIMLALPATHVLVLTTLDADEMVFEAVRAGAQAYLLKDASEQELIETVRGLCRGESWLTPQIARKVMDKFRALAGMGGNPGPAANQAGAATQATTGSEVKPKNDAMPKNESRAANAATSMNAETPTNQATPTVSSESLGLAFESGANARQLVGPGHAAAQRQAEFGLMPTETLTAKEEHILRLIVDGRSNRQIAAAVFLAEGTVKNYVSRIMAKLHANTRTELAVMAVRQHR